MQALTVQVDVPDLPAGAGRQGHFRRVAGFLDDNETICIATMNAGEREAQPELFLKLGDAAELAEACLSGDRRALTTPGLARMLSAACAVLLRVSVSAGGIQPRGGHVGDAGLFHDQQEAGGDEGADH